MTRSCTLFAVVASCSSPSGFTSTRITYRPFGTSVMSNACPGRYWPYVSPQPTSSTSRIQIADCEPHCVNRSLAHDASQFAPGRVRSIASVFARHHDCLPEICTSPDDAPISEYCVNCSKCQ
jgi:hypothetical protein